MPRQQAITYVHTATYHLLPKERKMPKKPKPNRSDIVRKYLAKHPNKTPAQVVKHMRDIGQPISNSLALQIRRKLAGDYVGKPHPKVSKSTVKQRRRPSTVGLQSKQAAPPHPKRQNALDVPAPGIKAIECLLTNLQMQIAYIHGMLHDLRSANPEDNHNDSDSTQSTDA